MGYKTNIIGTTNSSFEIGTAGPTVYTGSGVPSNALGVDGDIFIRVQNGSSNLYQKVSGKYYPFQSRSNNVVKKTANYQTTVIDEVVLVDSTNGPITITLGNTSTIIGFEIVIKDFGVAAVTNNITIVGQSGQTIDGASSYIIDTPRETVRVLCDGTNWQLV